MTEYLLSEVDRDARATRWRRVRLLAAALATVLMLGACSPEAAVRFWFADDQERAAVIVDCESNWDPDAVSPTNDHGLFQINAMWRSTFERVTGQPWSAVYEPEWNARFARWLYEDSGHRWTHWACRREL